MTTQQQKAVDNYLDISTGLKTVLHLLKANLGKTVNKRQLGKTPSESYSGKKSVYIGRLDGYGTIDAQFSNPVSQEDIDALEQRVSYFQEQAEKLQAINKEHARIERNELITLGAKFSAALAQFSSKYFDALENDKLFAEVFGTQFKEYTDHRRSY